MSMNGPISPPLIPLYNIRSHWNKEGGHGRCVCLPGGSGGWGEGPGTEDYMRLGEG